MLLRIINRKLSYNNNSLIEIDTCTAKASQFNHIEQSYKKKKLSQRWNDFNGIKVFKRGSFRLYIIIKNFMYNIYILKSNRIEVIFNEYN